jgi:hypothetical protein
MSLEGKRVAILVEADWDDGLTSALQAIEGAGAEITVVGNGKAAKYSGNRGKAEIIADMTAEELNSQDFDAVMVLW